MKYSGLANRGRSGELQPRKDVSRARTLSFIVAAVLAALIPLILFAGFWVRAVLDRDERDLKNRLTAWATSQSARLDTEVQQHLSILRAIASLSSLDTPDFQAFQIASERMLAASPSWTALALTDPGTGENILKIFPFLETLESDVPAAAWSDIARRTAEQRRPAISTYFSQNNGTRSRDMVLLSVPVIRGETVRFVLTAALKADPIQRLLVGGSQDKILILVADDNDRVLARSQGFDRFRGKPIGEQLQAAVAGRSSGLSVSRTSEGQNVLTAFQRSPLTGWVSVAATDRRYLDALTERSTLTLLIAGALSLTLAGVLAAFLFYSVVERRVSDERLAASRALGELDARLLAITQEALAEQRKSASEREVLLREIYHRVKNNLQIVQSLLRLGSRDLSDDQREPFESAIRRIGAMAKVHSLLYKSTDLASIDLEGYLKELLDEMMEGFGADQQGIRTELRVAPTPVMLDVAVPLAFIMVEVLTNAFKHAFPDGRGGVISVSVDREEERGVLSISDTGAGIPDVRGSRRSLGLNLVRKLVEQISGTLEAPAPGSSTYRITFPLGPISHSDRLPPPGDVSRNGEPSTGA